MSRRPDALETIIQRALSIFDFVADKSDILPVAPTSDVFQRLLSNPFGTGFGSLSSMGPTVDEVKLGSDIMAMESALITLVGEIRLVFLF